MTDSFAVGFYTHSLALIADAFHYVLFTQENLVDKTINKFAQLNDLVGFVVALNISPYYHQARELIYKLYTNI